MGGGSVIVLEETEEVRFITVVTDLFLLPEEDGRSKFRAGVDGAKMAEDDRR
jgi:hypothetical protein